MKFNEELELFFVNNIDNISKSEFVVKNIGNKSMVKQYILMKLVGTFGNDFQITENIFKNVDTIFEEYWEQLKMLTSIFTERKENRNREIRSVITDPNKLTFISRCLQQRMIA